MKIKTPEQYKARFERIGQKQKPKVTTSVNSVDITYGLSPNHKARAQSIQDVFGALYRPKAHKPKDTKSVRLVGDYSGCFNSLVMWYDEEDHNGRTVHIPYAYPCVVQHGWQRHPRARFAMDLVPSMGKKGEHRDKFGRTW